MTSPPTHHRKKLAAGICLLIIAALAIADQARKHLYGCKLRLTMVAGPELDSYSRKHGGHFPQALEPLNLPPCPESNQSYAYLVSPDREVYTLFCSGHHHWMCGCPANFPQYTSGGALRY